MTVERAALLPAAFDGTSTSCFGSMS